MRITASALFLILAFRIASHAQDISFQKENFPGREAEFNAAYTALQKGNEDYYAEPPSYEDALPFFLKANKFNTQNADLNCRIGLCYMNTGKKFDALPYFEKAFELKSTVDQRILFFIGAAWQVRNDFKKARTYFENYYKEVAGEKQETALVTKRLLECFVGDSLMANPVKVKIENLGATVNTEYPEYSPNITADESKIFFTSRRKGSFGGEVDLTEGKYFEDIYMSERSGSGKWQPAQNLGPPLNTKGHDATSGLSPDGHTLFVFKGDKGNGDILISHLMASGWSVPEDPGKNINTSAHESSASLSPDGHTIYFVSDRPGGLGGRDIYYTTWNSKSNSWNSPSNIGQPVNSKYEEEGVWMHPDGRTLYFSSKGNGSMGGYDIFCSTLDSGKWSAPVNLGYPVNTGDDDVFVKFSANGLTIYFASIKQEGFGDKDLYSATYLKTSDTKSKVALYMGNVLDEETKSPLSASVDLIDLNKNEVVGKYYSETSTGKFIVPLPSGKNYGAVIQADGYLFSSDNFNYADSSNYTEYTKTIYLKKIKVGNAVVLNNIFFETNKSDLKQQSENELQRLVLFMKVNQNLKIEIAGHTDNVGSDEKNMLLSESRAKAVAEYLKTKGISENRLTYKGYGETEPVAPNETVDGRALNRRTEIRVTAN